METIDLYQIHRLDPYTPVEETLAALDQLVTQGKVRYIGASSMYAWQFMCALGIADHKGWARFVSMQNLYNLLYREEEREMVPLCEAEGVGLIPWSPLARGLLARANHPQTATGRSTADPLLGLLRLPGDHAIITQVAQLAEPRGVTPAQIALAWLLSKPAVAAPIVGAAKLQYLEEAVAAVEIRLTRAECMALEQPYQPKPYLGITPPYQFPPAGAVHGRP